MGQRNLALDGLRGLAALAVALSHCALAVTGLDVWNLTLPQLAGRPPADLIGRLAFLVCPGDAAVMVFFVLSGHVLWLSFARSYRPAPAALPEYLAARLYRLMPVAIASAIPLGLLAGTLLPAIDARELVDTMLMLSTRTNGVLWSLQVELVCSLALFAVWIIVRGSTPALLGALVLSFVLYRVTKNPFLLFLPSFLAGALVSRTPAWLRHPAFLLLGLVVLLAANLVVGHGSRERIAETAGAYLLVAYVAGRQPALLVCRPVHLLGLISYPFYLTHVVGLQLAGRLLAEYPVAGPFGHFLVLAMVSIGATLPLAWLIHATVEVPALRGRPRFRPASRALSPVTATAPG